MATRATARPRASPTLRPADVVSSERAGSETGGDALAEAVAGAVADAGVLDELMASGARVGELIESLSAHSDPTVRDQVEEMLQSFDVLHREAMVRMAGLLARQHLLEQAVADPVLAFVFDLYELTPDQLKEAAEREEKATNAAASGGMIKLTDIRRFPAATPAATDPPADPDAQ